MGRPSRELLFSAFSPSWAIEQTRTEHMDGTVTTKSVTVEEVVKRIEREARADLAALLHEMRVYARHAVFCEYAPTYPDAPVATCDCGFDALLGRYAAIERAEHE